MCKCGGVVVVVVGGGLSVWVSGVLCVVEYVVVFQEGGRDFVGVVV
jgi:hypothetical protein